MESTTLPGPWREAVERKLEPTESVLAWFTPDLDPELQYARGLVVLTGQRLLAAGSTPPGDGWESYPVGEGTSLLADEQGGVGTLTLAGPEGRLAHWRYTAGLAPQVQRLVRRWRALGETEPAGEVVAAVCPSCGASITSEDGRCEACTPKAARPPVSALFRLAGVARPHLRLVVAGFVFTLAGTAASLVPPYLTMPLIDKVLVPYQSGHDVAVSLIGWYLAGLAGAALLAWVLDFGRANVLARVSESIAADLRLRMYAHLQRLSLEFFGGKRTGDLIARVSNDTERLCNFLSLNLVDFASDIIMIGMTACILLSINWMLALATLCPFPLILWLTYKVRARLLRGFRQSGIAWSDMTSVLADTIPGIRVVKAFAQERREVERFRTTNNRVLDINNRVNLVYCFFGPTVTLLTSLGLLVVWAFAAWLIVRDREHAMVTVGVLTLFLAYIARFYTRVESMIRMVASTQRAAASAQRIFEVLDRVPSVPEPVRPVSPGRLKGRIELRSVRFKYGPREVLHGLDLEVRPGEMIGLVGPSGAGKSTLINLVCRFYDVAAGAILVDGTDVRSFPVEEYRRNIGIVLQEPFLFYGTVAENIAYGRPNARRGRMNSFCGCTMATIRSLASAASPSREASGSASRSRGRCSSIPAS